TDPAGAGGADTQGRASRDAGQGRRGVRGTHSSLLDTNRIGQVHRPSSAGRPRPRNRRKAIPRNGGADRVGCPAPPESAAPARAIDRGAEPVRRSFLRTLRISRHPAPGEGSASLWPPRPYRAGGKILPLL